MGKTKAMLVLLGSTLFIVLIYLFVSAFAKRDHLIILATTLARGGSAEEGISKLRKALETKPTAARAAALATILSQTGRFAEAADAFELAETLNPQDLNYSVGRALMMTKSGQTETALSRVEDLRARWPQDAGLAMVAAFVLFELHRVDEAREQFRQSDELVLAFAEEQQVDSQTTTALGTSLRDRLGATSARAFEINPLSPMPRGEVQGEGTLRI